MSDLTMPAVARSAQPDAMQISDCVRPVAAGSSSPLADFEVSLGVLATFSSSMSSHPHPTTVGEMVVVAAVSSVESYFRDVLSGIIVCCPEVRSFVSKEMISLGAALSYPPEALAFALVEQMLFSSRGVIEEQLKKIMHLKMDGLPELRGAIQAFERACTCRHSAAHWRGYLDSSTVASLGLADGNTRYQIDMSYELAQRVLAACDHLVHVANDVLFGITVKRWIRSGRLVLDDDSRAADIEALVPVAALFFSDSGGDVSTAEELYHYLRSQDDE